MQIQTCNHEIVNFKKLINLNSFKFVNLNYQSRRNSGVENQKRCIFGDNTLIEHIKINSIKPLLCILA